MNVNYKENFSVCFLPEIDVALNSTTFLSEYPIARSNPLRYEFAVEMQYLSGDYAIEKLNGDIWNFEVDFIFSETEVSDGATLLNSSYLVAEIGMDEKQKGLEIGEQTNFL